MIKDKVRKAYFSFILKMTMNYTDAQNFISYTNGLGIRPGLDTVKELLNRLDNPQNKIKIIHVAGTNGKGSICAFLEYGLRECGLKVGRYISPTLFTYLERFQINGELMTEAEFSHYAEIIKTKCDEMVTDGLYHPTAFEVETAIAFLYMFDKNVDVMLLETGMGGKEDATNVVNKPIATVFASISYDHKKFLGNTIEEIAKNKAGIMRPLVPAIVSHMPEVDEKGSTAYNTLVKCAEKINTKIYYADDINKYMQEDGIEYNKEGVLFNGHNIDVLLKGTFQTENIKIALLTFKVLEKVLKQQLPSENISLDRFVEGLKKTVWPGRYEVMHKKPYVIRDGAHNIDAVRLLKETILNDTEIPDKVHLIMGVYADKEYEDILKEILIIAKSFTAITPPNKLRALDGIKLKDACISALNELRKNRDDLISENEITYKNNLQEAISSIKCKKDDAIIVFGSLSLAALFDNVNLEDL